MNFLVDTCVWIDLMENRKGYLGESLGGYSLRFFTYVLLKQNILVISDILVNELSIHYSQEQINSMFIPFNTKKLLSTKNQRTEAKQLAKERLVPKGDALHAILARDSDAILVSGDKDFNKLKDISKYFKPEELI